MAFNARTKDLKSNVYSPTKPASEAAIRAQIDDSIQEVFDNITTPLVSIADGASGLDLVGMTPINGVMTTPQQSFEYLKGRVDASTPNLDIITVKDYGAVGDGTDELSLIQQAMDAAAGKILYWNLQTGSQYLLDGMLTVPSNTTIIFQPGVLVKSLAGVTSGSHAFDIRNVDNINIIGNGAKITMDKTLYAGEGNHTFNIRSSHDITIDKVEIFENGGDGIYIGGQITDSRECSNIVINQCTIDSSRRNNISITYAENVTIESCKLLNASGTNPQYGIDIEPNGGTFSRYVNVNNCYAEGNGQAGFGIAFGAEYCNFNNCVAFDNVGIGFSFDGSDILKNNHNTLKNCLSRNNGLLGFYVRYSPNTFVENCRSLSNNNFGMQFTESENCIVSNNIIDDNASRGVVAASNGLRIVNNKISNNKEGGIVATAGSNCLISENYLEGNYGVSFDTNIYCSLSNSIISNNTCRKGDNVEKPSTGILVTSASQNSLIVNNDLFDSGESSSLSIDAASSTINKGNLNRNGEFSQNLGDAPEIITYTFDPPSIAGGSGTTSPNIPFTGARIGDFVLVSAPYNLQGVQATGYVSSTSNVVIKLTNSNVGAIDLGSGDWKIKLIKN